MAVGLGGSEETTGPGGLAGTTGGAGVCGSAELDALTTEAVGAAVTSAEVAFTGGGLALEGIAVVPVLREVSAADDFSAVAGAPSCPIVLSPK